MFDKRLTAFAVALLLTGCGGLPSIPTSSGASSTVKCPAILPPAPLCESCAEPQPELEFKDKPHEYVLAAYKDERAARLECFTINDACVRRDQIIDKEWNECK